MNRADILSYARTLVGTEYRHEGRAPGLGLDCVGLLTSIADKFKYPYRDVRGYSPQADGNLISRLAEFLDVVHDNRVKRTLTSYLPADVGVFWEDRGSKLDQHVGLFTDDGGIIHASVKAGKVIEVPLPRHWQKRILVVLRYRRTF